MELIRGFRVNEKELRKILREKKRFVVECNYAGNNVLRERRVPGVFLKEGVELSLAIAKDLDSTRRVSTIARASVSTVLTED
jgi:hypothetical protein